MRQSNHRLVIDAHVHLFEAPEALPQVFRDSLYQVWEEKFGKEGAEKRRKGLAACLHWLASRRSAFILEYCVEETPIRQDLTKQKLAVVDGYVNVPEGPGLGIELDEEVVERYRVA